MEFLQNIDWMLMLKCFTVGGLICVVGQILIDKTKLTPAKILVLFVTLGAVLGGLRNLFKACRFCRCWSNCTSYRLWKRFSKRCCRRNTQNTVRFGIFTGGFKATAGGVAAAIFFGYIAALVSKPKMKKQ